MDVLDIFQGRYYQLNPANYYDTLPVPQLIAQDPSEIPVPEPIDFEWVDTREWQYRALIGNLIDRDSANATIKTRDAIDYKVGGYITINGRLYTISSVTEDVSASSREARAIMMLPLGTEYVLRLVEIENPWGIE